MSSTSAMRQSYSCQSAVDDRSNDMIAQFWPLNSAVACSVSANKLIVDWSHLPSMKALTSKNPYTKNTHVFNITHTIPYAILNQKRSAHPAWISGAPKALLCSMSDHKRLLEFTFNKLLDSAIHKVTKVKNVADVVHLQHRQAQKAFELAFAYSANLTSRRGKDHIVGQLWYPKISSTRLRHAVFEENVRLFCHVDIRNARFSLTKTACIWDRADADLALSKKWTLNKCLVRAIIYNHELLFISIQEVALECFECGAIEHFRIGRFCVWHIHRLSHWNSTFDAAHKIQSSQKNWPWISETQANGSAFSCL